MIICVMALVVAACWPTISALHEAWTAWHATDYTHGYLTAGVSAFLLWQARSSIQAVSGTRPLVLISLLCVGVVWVFCVRAGIAAGQWVLLPVLMLLAVWGVGGRKAAKRGLFAISFLYFAMPLWGFINPLFQWSTVYIVRGMLRLVGIPSHFVGNEVQIPSGTFEIAGGCSGLHYVIVALSIAALLGEVRGDAWKARAKLLAIGLGLAIATNCIRVFVIILAGHATHMQHYLVANSHSAFGWALFIPAMLLLFLLERRMPLTQASVQETAIHREPPFRVRYFAPTAMALFLIGILQLLTAMPSTVRLTDASVSGWSERLVEPERSWAPVVEGADANLTRAYVDGSGREVEQRRYLFLWQGHKKELGNYNNDLLGGGAVLESASESMTSGPIKLFHVMDSVGGRWLVGVRYETDGSGFDQSLRAQLSYAWRSVLRLRSVGSSIVLWRTSCVPDCASARGTLFEFLAASSVEE